MTSDNHTCFNFAVTAVVIVATVDIWARKMGSLKSSENKWTWIHEHTQACTWSRNSSMYRTFKYLSKPWINWSVLFAQKDLLFECEFNVCKSQFNWKATGKALHLIWIICISKLSRHYQPKCWIADLYAIRFDINNLIFTRMQMLSKFASLRLCITNIIIIKTLCYLLVSLAPPSHHSFSTLRLSSAHSANRSLRCIHNFQWTQNWLKWILSLHLIKLRTKPFGTTANYLLAQ